MTYEMRRNPDLTYELVVEERGQTTCERFVDLEALLERADQLTRAARVVALREAGSAPVCASLLPYPPRRWVMN